MTLVDPFFGRLDTPTALGYVAAQVAGAIAGAVTANLMFHLPAVTWSTTERSVGYLWFAEGVATYGRCG